MADSIRQSIINAIDARLKTITIANSYETDLGRNVFEHRTTALGDSELPGINFRDVGCDVSEEDVAIGQHGYELIMEAEILVKEGSTTAVQIRKMIADVIKAIGVDPRWGNLAVRTSPVSDSLKFEQSEKIIAGALLTFPIIFRTNKFNPYA